MKPLKENRQDAVRCKNHFKATMTIVALFLSLICKSQQISSAVGVRAAQGGLITYQHQIYDSYIGEGIIATRWNGIEITALIEKYTKAFKSENTHWYLGAGIHLGFHGRDNSLHPNKDKNAKTHINPGIDFIGGLAYTFKKLPLHISVDYKPSIHFTGTRSFVGEGIGLSLRYIIRYS